MNIAETLQEIAATLLRGDDAEQAYFKKQRIS
jgi:hypothetical protein